MSQDNQHVVDQQIQNESAARTKAADAIAAVFDWAFAAAKAFPENVSAIASQADGNLILRYDEHDAILVLGVRAADGTIPDPSPFIDRRESQWADGVSVDCGTCGGSSPTPDTSRSRAIDPSNAREVRALPVPSTVASLLYADPRVLDLIALDGLRPKWLSFAAAPKTLEIRGRHEKIVSGASCPKIARQAELA